MSANIDIHGALARALARIVANVECVNKGRDDAVVNPGRERLADRSSIAIARMFG
ncbi:hypothetical protein [Flexivirga alba]|uniref:Uncharacterized protein n=1 Tax=Flexivirga alba TaxID=702742 RepID=A0ABW2AFZ7_9MICO